MKTVLLMLVATVGLATAQQTTTKNGYPSEELEKIYNDHAEKYKDYNGTDPIPAMSMPPPDIDYEVLARFNIPKMELTDEKSLKDILARLNESMTYGTFCKEYYPEYYKYDECSDAKENFTEFYGDLQATYN